MTKSESDIETVGEIGIAVSIPAIQSMSVSGVPFVGQIPSAVVPLLAWFRVSKLIFVVNA